MLGLVVTVAAVSGRGPSIGVIVCMGIAVTEPPERGTASEGRRSGGVIVARLGGMAAVAEPAGRSPLSGGSIGDWPGMRGATAGAAGRLIGARAGAPADGGPPLIRVTTAAARAGLRGGALPRLWLTAVETLIVICLIGPKDDSPTNAGGSAQKLTKLLGIATGNKGPAAGGISGARMINPAVSGGRKNTGSSGVRPGPLNTSAGWLSKTTSSGSRRRTSKAVGANVDGGVSVAASAAMRCWASARDAPGG